MTSDNLIPNDPRFHLRLKTRRQAGEQLKELLERERNELEDEFVADNIVMLVQRAEADCAIKRRKFGYPDNRDEMPFDHRLCEDTDFLADTVVEIMREKRGPGWKYSTGDVIELIDEAVGIDEGDVECRARFWGVTVEEMRRADASYDPVAAEAFAGSPCADRATCTASTST